MRTILMLALSLCFAMSGAAVAQQGMTSGSEKSGMEKFGIGKKAPMADLAMTATDGKQYSIKDVAGEKGTLVIVTCNHCPYVKAWDERMTDIAKKAQKNGFGVLMVNPNDPSAFPEDDVDGMKKKVKDQGYTFPYVVDAGSKLTRALGATKTPEVFLFDADMKLAYHGAPDDNSRNASKVEHHYLKDALAAVAAGKEADPKETKALGCGIKFQEPSSASGM